MKFDVILRISVKLFLPFILLFGFYVQFHGDYSPGGGFQAGVIISAAVMLYTLIFGLSAAKYVAPPWLLHVMIPTGVAIYAGTGVASMFLGGNYLEHTALFPNDQVYAQEWGIFMVEIGVLITVAGAMISIFHTFVGRGR